jgi:NADP-dependent 3-hydroxy acid dehydrogenase YdfG
MASPLAGRVALVTGASSGIGAATAIALGAAGANVVVVARRAERLRATAERIEAAGVEALQVCGDVAVEQTAQGAVTAAMTHFGRLDILVNAAGIIQAANVEHADTAQWRRLFEVNVLASLYTCHAALAPMRAQGSGNIINIGSLACRQTSPVFNSYSASKYALNSMTDGLRQEANPHGVRVCMIAPGPTRTEVAEGITDAAYRDAIRTFTHQAGALEPGDVAETVVFIASAPQRVNISELWIRATADTSY